MLSILQILILLSTSINFKSKSIIMLLMLCITANYAK